MTSMNLSRRNFLAGSTIGALALVGGLTACAAPSSAETTAETTSDSNKSTASDTPMETTSTNTASMTSTAAADETLECDIVVVGAGISGLAAAVQAAQDGNRVIVLEKAASAGGNGSGTEGVFAVNSTLQEDNGIKIEPMEIIRTELSESQWRSNGALWVDLVNNSADNITWLQGNGVEFSGVVDNYHTGLYDTMHWFKDSAGALSYVPQMQEAAEKAGAEFRFSTAGKEIVMEGDKVKGIRAEDQDGKVIEITAPAVILASGGIGANHELLLKVGMDQNKIDNMMTMCVPSVEGDGFNMASAVGAGSYLPNAAIQAFQAVKAFGTDTTPPYDSPLNGGNGIVGCGTCIWVNQEARRFSDESLAITFNMAANAGACMGNRNSYAIFDQSILDAANLDEADQKIVDDALADSSNKTSVMKADSLDELAENFGIDADELNATVKLYNEYCAQGLDGEFGKDKAFLKAIDTPPYYMADIINLLVVVDGSILTNGKAEVTTQDMVTIPGLYAVGLDGAMLWHNMYTQNMPGTVMANNVNSGRTAAKNAGEYIKA